MSEFIQGFQTTEGEKKYDYNALGNLPDLSISKDDITGALGFVPPSKAEVEASVKIASDAAATADRKAVAAQTTANQAVGAAQQAQTAADDAVLAAQNAQNRADDAHERIDDSQTQIVQGSIITIDDCDNAPLQNLRIFGKTTQNGIPTPEAPVPLESVGDGGSVGVTVTGKNLLSAQQMYSQCDSYLETSIDGRNCVRMTSGASVTIETDFLKPNTQYSLSLTCKTVLKGNATTSQGNSLIRIKYDDNTRQDLYGGITEEGWITKYLTTSKGKTITSISIAAYDYKAYTYIDVDTFQFEEGAKSTDYEPYKGNTLTIQKPEKVDVLLPGIPYVDTSYGDNPDFKYTDETGQQWVCDEVDFKRGVYVQRVVKKILDGTETWAKPSSTHHGTKIGAYGYVVGGMQLSSHFIGTRVVGSNRDIGIYVLNSEANNGAFIYVRLKQESMTSDEFKAWLSENPVTVYYALTEPIEHELSAEELAQYAALHTNYPNTTIYNDGGAGLEVQYATPSTVLSLSGGRMNGSIDMVNHQLTGLPTPKNNTDAVSLEYLQETKLELAQGINDVSDIAYGAQETADEALEEAVEANERIDDSQVQVVRGEVVSIGNSADAPLQGLRIFGKTTQNGEPSPTNPVPLESVGDDGSVTATVCGRNLLTNNIFTVNADFNGLTVTLNEDGSLHITGTAVGAANIGLLLSSPIPKGKKVYVYVDGNGNNGCRLISRTANGTKVYGNFRPTGIHEVRDGNNSIQEYFEAFAVAVRIADGDTADMTVKLMVAETECEYEAPKEPQNLTISTSNSLPGIPVTSGGNYTDENGKQWICDEVDFEKGQYIQNIGREVWNGTEAWNYVNKYENMFYFRHELSNPLTGNDNKPGVVMSDRFKEAQGLNNTIEHIRIHGVNGYAMLFIDSSRLASNSVEDLKAWLAENNVTFLYRMGQSIPRELTEAEKAAYAVLHSNYPNTTVFNDGNTGMEVKYATPTTVLPITGGRYKVATPYAPTDAVPKSYADRIDKKVDTLREVVSSFHSNIVQEASGEMIQVYGSAEAPLAGLKVFGKTKQRTTTGKNLFDVPYLAMNGTGNRNDTGAPSIVDGVLRVKRTNTTSTSPKFFVNLGTAVPFLGKTLYLKAKAKASTSVAKFGFGIGFYKETDKVIKNAVYSAFTYNTTKLELSCTFNVPDTLDENSPNLGMVVYADNVASITTQAVGDYVDYWDIMISFDDVAYEPYTGGKPSPSPEYPQPLESVGDVRVGKNLIYCPDKVFTDRGVTTVVNNGCATLSGTSDAAVNITLATYAAGYRTHLPAGTYTFSGHSGTSGYTLIFVCYDTNEATSPTKYVEIYQATGSKTVTFESDIWLGCYIYGTGAGVSYNNIRVCPQVELGSTATAYEPYTIKGGMPNVTMYGKNLFDYKRLPTKTYNGMTLTNNGDGSFTLPNGSTGEFLYYKDYSNAESRRIFRPGTYTLSLGLKTGAITRPYFFVGFRDAKGSVKELTNEGSTFTLTKERIESDGFFVRVGFYMSASSTATGETIYPMLRMFGDNTFENHKEPQILPVLAYNGLPGIPALSGSNYTDENGQRWVCDEVDVARGKYVQRLCTVSFDGSADESMDYTSDNTTVCGGWVRFAIPYKAKSDNNITPNLLCDRFITVRNNTGVFTEGVCTISSSKEHMAFISSKFSSVDTARAWFALHPITAVYEMETPIESDLTTEQLAAYTSKYGSTAKIYGKTIQIGTPSTEKPVQLIDTSLVLTSTTTGLSGLLGIPAESGGNYTDENGQQWICDEVDFEKGVYVQRIGKLFLDGSSDEPWYMGATVQSDKKRKYVPVEDKKVYGSSVKNEPMICDRYQISANGTSGNCYNCITSFSGVANYNRIYFYDEAVPGSDFTEWRNYLAEHPITVLYPLAEEKHIPLSDIDPNVLTQYAVLHTNYPNTTVYNDGGAEMDMKYVADTKIYVDKKFEELAEILVNKL